jgi:hypothetical protein
MTELMNYSNQHVSLQDKVQYAERLASASLLPAAYKKQPANVLLAMEMGDAMGIPPIQAINEIHVIEGKPSASANLIGAMVRRAGHKLRVQGDDQSATAQIIRADDPDFTFEVTWTLERAKNAGLLSGKNNWAKYPAAMLKARAITEVARAATPDALYGVIYTPEELGATVNEDGTPVEPASVPNTMPPMSNQTNGNGGGSRIAQARQQTQARQPEQPSEPTIDEQQWNTINQALVAVGVEEPARKPQAITDILGRSIANPFEIRVSEFDTIMAALTEGTVEDAEIVEEPDAEVAQEALEEFINE